MSRSILVTGGTGKTGRRLVSQLRDAGHVAHAGSRSGSGDTRKFDWLDRATWHPALEGIDAVYLVSPAIQGDPAPILIDFIKEAIDQSVSRFTLLSASLLPPGGPAMGQVHEWLEEHGPEWAVLRPTWFMQNFSEAQHLQTIRDENKIYSATEDGAVPFISADDIASAALATLTSESAADRDFILTGGELLTYDDVARRLSTAIGRTVIHERISMDALTQRNQALGMAAQGAQILAMMDVAIGAGAEDRLTEDFEALTGQSPVPFDAFVAANQKVW